MSAGRKASRTRVWPVLRLGIEFPDYPPTGTGPKLRRREEVIPGTVTRAHARTARGRSLVLSRRGLLLRRLRQHFRPAQDLVLLVRGFLRPLTAAGQGRLTLL